MLEEVRQLTCPQCIKKEGKEERVEDKEKILAERKVKRDIRRTVKMLKEVWMKIGVEKIDMHEEVAVKALLDSRATGLFVDKTFGEKNSFKMQELERPVDVKNVDGTGNSGGRITHKIEVDIFFKGHVEREKMDVYNLGKTEVTCHG